MGWRAVTGVAVALALASSVLSAGQPSSAATIVDAVRTAIAAGGVARGEQTLGEYRSANGVTPAALEALSELARAALTEKLYDKAARYAEEARTTAAARLRDGHPDDDSALLKAVGSATEVTALLLVEQGARSDAVYLLQSAVAEYSSAPIAGQLESAIITTTLEGRTAPAIEPGVSIGTRLSRSEKSPQLLFFWAHWCLDCKSESPMLARIADKYRARGLTIVAPTRRYGYIENGRSAAPDKELRHILQIRNERYGFLRDAPVPVADANFKAFGVAAVPMHVLIDRQGIVRLYRPGVMTEAELDAAIGRVLNY